ncbi:alpha/beta fold hydrolase [Pedobacter lithocola]|uniref:Alpha/beta fold hydrolase n=1 Tax=Pedobacter lithocola TaxID=1908239 RepID=A0ABV8PBL7_9SPHI
MKTSFVLLAVIGSLLFNTAVKAQSKNKMETINYHQTATTQYIESNGTRYAYRILGKCTGIPLVLLQHFTGSMDNWDPKVTNELAAGSKVVLFDNKGVGATGGESADNIAQMAKDAIGFIKALGYTKVNLLGFSMGGFIAQQIALDEPGLVNKLILAGTGQKGAVDIAEIVKPLARIASMSDEDQKLFLFYTATEHSRDLGKAAMSRIYQRTIDRDPNTATPAIMLQLQAILAWAQPDPDSLSRINKIGQPVLIVNGSNDTMVPTINSYIMFQNIPNARLSLYPDAGHGSIFQYPDLFVNEATAFIAQ